MAFTLQTVLYLLLSFLLGLLIGWFVRNRRVQSLQKELDASSANRREIRQELDDARARVIELEDRIVLLEAEPERPPTSAPAPDGSDRPNPLDPA